MIFDRLAYPWKLAVLGLLLLSLAGCDLGCDEDDPVAPQGERYDFRSDIGSFPLGFVDVAYQEDRVINGGDGPYRLLEFTVAPPAWMTVEIFEGRYVRVTGTPDAPGTFTAKIRIQDSLEVRGFLTIEVEVLRPTDLSLVGDWLLTIDVTQVQGAFCEGEQDEVPSTDQVLVGQFGNRVTITGIQGSSGNTLSGTLHPDLTALARLYVTGSFPEDGGVTTVEYYDLDVVDGNTLSGRERWLWDFFEQHCEGYSDVTMTRVR